MSLVSFFKKEEKPNDVTAENSKTVNKKKDVFQKYQQLYLNYRLIATGNSYFPSLFCVILVMNYPKKP